MTTALAINTSKGPPLASKASAHVRTLLRLARSRATISKLPPAAAAASRTRAVATSALPRSRAAPTTRAPCAARARAVSTPRPAETPVTKIRLPLRFTPDSTSSVVEVAPNVLSIFGTSSLEERIPLRFRVNAEPAAIALAGQRRPQRRMLHLRQSPVESENYNQRTGSPLATNANRLRLADRSFLTCRGRDVA